MSWPMWWMYCHCSFFIGGPTLSAVICASSKRCCTTNTGAAKYKWHAALSPTAFAVRAPSFVDGLYFDGEWHKMSLFYKGLKAMKAKAGSVGGIWRMMLNLYPFIDSCGRTGGGENSGQNSRELKVLTFNAWIQAVTKVALPVVFQRHICLASFRYQTMP